MSYILDALRKSEQERRQSQVPDLQTQHTPPPQKGRGKRLWPWLIVAALLLNAALLTWHLGPWSEGEPLAADPAAVDDIVVATAEPAPVPTPLPPPASPTAEPSAETAAPPPQPEISDARQAAPPEPPPAPTPSAEAPPAPAATPQAAAPPGVPRLEDLPLSLRRQIPDLAISLHFYTDAPAARMVRINGRNLREKQRVDENITVREITEEGVVLDFNGQLFAVKNF